MNVDWTRVGYVGLVATVFTGIFVNTVWASQPGKDIFGTNPISYPVAWITLQAAFMLAGQLSLWLLKAVWDISKGILMRYGIL